MINASWGHGQRCCTSARSKTGGKSPESLEVVEELGLTHHIADERDVRNDLAGW